MDLEMIKMFLEKSDLIVPDEFALHQWVVTRIEDESRTGMVKEHLQQLLPLIRFQMMSLLDLDRLADTEFVRKHIDQYNDQYIIPALRSHAHTRITTQESDTMKEPRLYSATGGDVPLHENTEFAHRLVVKNYYSKDGGPYHFPTFMTPVSLSCADSNEKFLWRITMHIGNVQSPVVQSFSLGTPTTQFVRRHPGSGPTEKQTTECRDITRKHRYEPHKPAICVALHGPGSDYAKFNCKRNSVCLQAEAHHSPAFKDEYWSLSVYLAILCQQESTEYVKYVVSKSFPLLNNYRVVFQMYDVIELAKLKIGKTEYLIDGNLEMMFICKPIMMQKEVNESEFEQSGSEYSDSDSQ
ncbi:uncharacterized protein LOC144363270 [Saccoglossus kowalevskii]